MRSSTTSHDVCRSCESEWRAGWKHCHRCGATSGNRVSTLEVAPDASGLELDRRPRPAPRRGEPTRVPTVDPSEALTRELVPETRPRADPSALLVVTQLLSAAVGALLLAQVLLPAVLPSLGVLALHRIRGEQVGRLDWLLATAPWGLTAVVLGLALTASRQGVERPLVRSPWSLAVAAVVPGLLLWGWPKVHGHLASALIRRGGRKGAGLLTWWSRAALVCLSAEVLLGLLGGLGLLTLPPMALVGVVGLTLAARQGHLCALGITLPGLVHRPAPRTAALPSQLLCPECGADAPTLQRFREGLAGSACSRCAGALLGPGQVSTLLSMAHVEDDLYLREIRLGSTGSRALECPQCGVVMRDVQLRAVMAHGCPGCGSLWVDRVGLARLTGGRAVLTVAPARPAPAPRAAWPALAAVAALAIAAWPWVAVRAGWCRPDEGACVSVTASATRE